jgi:predicted glycogen debranching enzyme
MQDPTLIMPWPGAKATDMEPLITREWLVTNGLGGYASGAISGVVTRRYHGLLISALPTPLGRVVMLNEISEQLKFADRSRVDLGGEERGTSLLVHGAPYLVEFRLELGLPVWRYQVKNALLEKRVLLVHRQNTVHINYRLLDGPPLALRLRPALHIRPHDARVDQPLSDSYQFTALGERYEIVLLGSEWPPLRMMLHGEDSSFTVYGRKLTEVVYRIEESRGYEHRGDLWSPGHFWADLTNDRDATFVASTESWENIQALPPQQARDAESDRRRRLLAASHPAAQSDMAAQLVLAADQFVISPTGRVEDAARARAAGDEVRTVIAG